MIDAELLADLRRLVTALMRSPETLRLLPEWQRDLIANVPDKAVKDLVSDFRNYSPTPRADPSAKVLPVGAGRVVGGDDTVASTGTGGWVEPPRVDSWRPPGVDICDQLMDQADAIDRAERIRQLAQTAAIQRAEAEIKAQQEAELSKKPKGGPQK
jgi:hypothetical protein